MFKLPYEIKHVDEHFLSTSNMTLMHYKTTNKLMMNMISLGHDEALRARMQKKPIR
jgi:hypothetical protein